MINKHPIRQTRISGLSTICAVAITLLLSACATLSPDYEQPVVSLTHFRPMESAAGESGAGMGFEIGLRILNPNREPLNLEGVVYTVRLQGQDVVKGVGKGYEPIEGYGEGEITLTAVPQFLAGIRLLSGMMSQPTEGLQYEFEAKLDVGGFYPRIRVSETGEFNFNQATR